MTLQDIDEIELFRGLSAAQAGHVLSRLYSRVFPPGYSLITAEQPGEVVYLIRSGTLKIHIEQVDGRDVILALLGPGDIVGEMSLIDSAGRSASVVTLEESHLIWMDGADFQEFLRSYAPFARNLVRILSGRVRQANDLIQSLAALDVNGRVARQLLSFAEKYGRPAANGGLLVPIRLTQGDIADLVGASRKRVNQAMVCFKQQGYLAVDEKGRVTLLDRPALARLCA
ncbi:MAG: Crp/Fnr family transcriptional regulator [Chloroflexota bacterium]